MQHHVSEAGNNPWGILNPQYTTLSMFDNSGSLFLNYGDVSGSASSTGSFGSVFVSNINNGKSLSIGDNTRGNHEIYDLQLFKN